MNEAENQSKQRDRRIAENESEQQVTGDIRVSAWAIAVAVIIGVVTFGWLMSR